MSGALLAQVEDSLRYWTGVAMRDQAGGDSFKTLDRNLQRAANLATIAIALRAARGEQA